jgi:hypothetical protein
MVGEPLWTSQKDGHSAEARVRAISSIGLELRFSIDGELSTRIASQRGNRWSRRRERSAATLRRESGYWSERL